MGGHGRQRVPDRGEVHGAGPREEQAQVALEIRHGLRGQVVQAQRRQAVFERGPRVGREQWALAGVGRERRATKQPWGPPAGTTGPRGNRAGSRPAIDSHQRTRRRRSCEAGTVRGRVSPGPRAGDGPRRRSAVDAEGDRPPRLWGCQRAYPRTRVGRRRLWTIESPPASTVDRPSGRRSVGGGFRPGARRLAGPARREANG